MKDHLPAMTRSSEYRNDDLSKLSAVIGMGSIVEPSNLYNVPVKDGMIRIHSPLFVN